MNYGLAKQLHNDDEVAIKNTKEAVKVITVRYDDKNVYVEAMTQDGFKELHHTEIE